MSLMHLTSFPSIICYVIMVTKNTQTNKLYATHPVKKLYVLCVSTFLCFIVRLKMQLHPSTVMTLQYFPFSKGQNLMASTFVLKLQLLIKRHEIWPVSFCAIFPTDRQTRAMPRDCLEAGDVTVKTVRFHTVPLFIVYDVSD